MNVADVTIKAMQNTPAEEFGNIARMRYSKYAERKQKDVGKIIWARNKEFKGTITKIVDRWCAGCQSCRMVYSVKWDDGRRTYPCPAGCKDNADGSVEII